jgi:anti-anti-sigma factor
MPTEWSENIVLADLGDEPELSEELSATYARVSGHDGRAAPQNPGVVLNFSGVTYLNSSHIASLLRLRKAVRDAKGLMVLCALHDNVWSVILHTGLDRVFEFAPDTMTALARVQIESEGRGS